MNKLSWNEIRLRARQFAHNFKAHQALDKVVDCCYRKEPFTSERERVEYLFQLYEQLTAPLAASSPKSKRKRKAAP